MKKFIVLSFVTLLMLAFGSIVYGQEKAPVLEFKASGFIDAQTLWWENVTGGNPTAGIYDVVGPTFAAWAAAQGRPTGSADKSTAYFEARARLRFDAIMGKDLSGTFLFEMDSATWGDVPGGTGLNKLSERNTYGYWAADRAALEIKNVYFDWGLPYFGIPAPMTARIGLQAFALRPNLLLTTDGMGINFAIKPDPVLIQFLYGKPVEGRVSNADDVDMYGLHANARLGTITVGGYALYYNMNSYPFFVPSVVLTSPAGNAAILYTGTQQANMGWYGAYVDGKLGPINLNADFIMDYGKVRGGTYGREVYPSVKYKGWMSRLAVSYPWEKFAFGASGAYASGSSTGKTSSTGLAGSSTADGAFSTSVKSFVVPVGSEAGPAFGEGIVFYSSWVNRGDSGIGNSLNYSALSRGPLGGTWYVKPFFSVQALPWFKATVQGFYIGDTTRLGNTVGTARNSDGTLRDDKTIGWEGDIILEFQILKNLKYTAAGGYLWKGDGLYFYSGNPAIGNLGPNNPWQITSNLTYSF